MDPALLEEFCAEYTAHLNRLRGEKNASLAAARTELGKLGRDRERLNQAIKDGVPASEVRDDLARIAARREELEALLDGTTEEPVLLHPNMAAHYRAQVARLAEALNAEENRAEAADLLRSLVDRIELTPNDQGKLEISLYGDLAGILTLATNKDRPLEASDRLCSSLRWLRGQDSNLQPAVRNTIAVISRCCE
jgi:site-specific DNA recombinase